MTTAATKFPAPARPAAGPRRTPWGLIAGLVVLGAAVAGGAYYLRARPAHAAHDGDASAHGGAAEEGHGGAAVAVPVQTVRPEPGGIVRTSTQIGSVHPFEVAELYAKVSGYLKDLKVDYGDRVKKGQLLAVIDDPEVVKEAQRDAAALEQARAAVKQSEAKLKTAEADQRAAAAAVEEARAEVERTASRTRYREKVLTRYRKLVAQSAEAPEIVEEQEEHLESARADEHSAKAGLSTAQAKAAAAAAYVEKARADVLEAKATVDVDQANLEKSQVLVDYTKITSPYDGVITDRKFFRGAFIRSAAEGNNTPLLTVARTDVVRVVTMVPDRDVPYVDVGDQAELTLDALGDETLKGKVARFSDREDPASRTMHTEIDLPNPDGKIRPGMYGVAKIILDDATRAMTLPASCLTGESERGSAEVYVVRDGKAHRTKVKVGADDGIRVEIVSGLKRDDEVITATTGVADGMPVKPTRAVAEKSGPEASHG